MLCVGMVAATEAEGSGFVGGSGDVGWPDTRVLLDGRLQDDGVGERR